MAHGSQAALASQHFPIQSYKSKQCEGPSAIHCPSMPSHLHGQAVGPGQLEQAQDAAEGQQLAPAPKPPGAGRPQGHGLPQEEHAGEPAGRHDAAAPREVPAPRSQQRQGAGHREHGQHHQQRSHLGRGAVCQRPSAGERQRQHEDAACARRCEPALGLRCEQGSSQQDKGRGSLELPNSSPCKHVRPAPCCGLLELESLQERLSVTGTRAASLVLHWARPRMLVARRGAVARRGRRRCRRERCH